MTAIEANKRTKGALYQPLTDTYNYAIECIKDQTNKGKYSVIIDVKSKLLNDVALFLEDKGYRTRQVKPSLFATLFGEACLQIMWEEINV